MELSHSPWGEKTLKSWWILAFPDTGLASLTLPITLPMILWEVRTSTPPTALTLLPFTFWKLWLQSGRANEERTLGPSPGPGWGYHPQIILVTSWDIGRQMQWSRQTVKTLDWASQEPGTPGCRHPTCWSSWESAMHRQWQPKELGSSLHVLFLQCLSLKSQDSISVLWFAELMSQTADYPTHRPNWADSD